MSRSRRLSVPDDLVLDAMVAVFHLALVDREVDKADERRELWNRLGRALDLPERVWAGALAAAASAALLAVGRSGPKESTAIVDEYIRVLRAHLLDAVRGDVPASVVGVGPPD